MKEEELLKNISEIRKSLQELQKGMVYLISSVNVANQEVEEEGDNSLELKQPVIEQEGVNGFKTYLG